MLRRVRRFDLFRLDLAPSSRRRDTDGCLVTRGRVARTGIQEYDDGLGGRRREYRPADEVGAPEAVASFDGVAITDLHPEAGLVTPTTYRALARGHIQSPSFTDGWLEADFFIADEELARKVEAGERVEISAGYTAELDETPGTTPEGEPYDAVQRSPRGNHAALLPAGTARAGREARLILDSTGAQIAPTEDRVEEEEKKTSEEEAAPPPEEEDPKDDVVALKRDLAAAKKELDSLRRSLDEARAMADAQRDRADKLEAAAKGASEKTDSIVAARLALIARATKLAGREVKVGSEAEIIRDALSARGCVISDADAKNALYLRARFDATEELVGLSSKASTTATLPTTDPIGAALAARREKRS